MTQAEDLRKLLQRIFEDTIVEPKEREALAEFTRTMSHEETREVFRSFMEGKWGEAIADGALTTAELRLLGHIVGEFKLRPEDLSPQARLALKDLL